MMHIEHDELVTPREVAQMLKLKNPHTLAIWRCSGRFPELKFKKFGGKIVRYYKSSVLKFLAAD